MTTGAYADEHADALATIRAAGADVSFTKTTTPRNETTDVAGTPVTVTVTGAAIRVKGSPIRYQALNLVQTEAPTLLFAPDTYGELPPLNASVTWNDIGYTVRDIDVVVAIDGKALLARVVVAR